jgi:hypothetical protein
VTAWPSGQETDPPAGQKMVSCPQSPVSRGDSTSPQTVALFWQD